MNGQLISKIKQLNEQSNVKEWALHLLSSEVSEIDFPLKSLSVALGDLLDANIYIINVEGQLHGYYEQYRVNTGRIRNMIEKRILPYNYMQRLDKLKTTMENIEIDDNLTIFPVEKRSHYPDALTTLVPIEMSGERLGMLIIGRMEEPLNELDVLVAEHAASIIGVEMAFDYARHKVETKKQIKNAELAMSALSTSEVNAIRGIFNAMGEQKEMRLIASDIADELGITRSIIVNSLRKLVTASVIDQRSMGMKGTYINILNPYFVDLLFQEN